MKMPKVWIYIIMSKCSCVTPCKSTELHVHIHTMYVHVRTYMSEDAICDWVQR